MRNCRSTPLLSAGVFQCTIEPFTELFRAPKSCRLIRAVGYHRSVSRRKGILALGVVLLIAAGTAGFVLERRSTARKSKPPPVLAASAPAVFEGTEANLTGRVQPITTITVGAPIDGVLESYFVEVNQEVYQGQLLGRIRNARLETAEQQAEAQLEKAQARLTNLDAEGITARMEASRAAAEQVRARGEMERLEKLYQRQQALMREGATPRLTFEKAEKDYTAAKNEFETLDSAAKSAEEHVAALERELERTRELVASATEAAEQAKASLAIRELRAPVDGVVVGRKGQPGEPVDPSMKDLLEIATNLTAMRIVATPAPEVLARIHPGQQATIRIPGLSTEELPGSVREIRGPDVIVDFTSPAAIVKLGIAAQIRIKL